MNKGLLGVLLIVLLAVVAPAKEFHVDEAERLRLRYTHKKKKLLLQSNFLKI